MKIIVDIDNTLWHFAPVLYEYLKEVNPHIPPMEEWGAWKFWERDMDTKTFYKMLRKIHMSQEQFAPYPEAQWFLNCLKERGFTVLIASHREKDAYGPTERWLRKWGLHFDELHVMNDKSRLFQGAFGVVDDSPITLAKASEAGMVTTGLRFPWNQGFDYALFDNLSEVLGYIDLMRSSRE